LADATRPAAVTALLAKVPFFVLLAILVGLNSVALLLSWRSAQRTGHHP
jgi:hypothetical protein